MKLKRHGCWQVKNSKQANIVTKVVKNDTGTMWHLYLIRLKSGHLYTGITTDVARRFSEHKNGRGAKFLRGREGLELVFNRAIGDRSSALKIEAAIKKLPKQRKEALINGDLAIDGLLNSDNGYVPGNRN